MSLLRRWRRARTLRHEALDAELWRRAVEHYPFALSLPPADLERLRQTVVLFLAEKSIHGAAGMAVRDDVRIAVALQACILVLNLGLDYYRGWVEIILYPDEFIAEYEYIDEAGVSHHVQESMSGESWSRGPVVLSWADAEIGGQGEGYNVVIHEFAHKLDMLNGEPNGFPPLHTEMVRSAWASAFSSAYDDFCQKVDAGYETEIDEYAAESPAEFFAVMSEAFFEVPHAVLALYPGVYEQLRQFYRQDTAARFAESDLYGHARPAA